MKILYIDPIVHSKTSASYKYYDGLFNSLSKIHECELYFGDVTAINKTLSEMSRKPDVMIFGLGYNGFHNEKVLRDINLPKIGFVFKPQDNLNAKMEFFRKNQFDILFTSLPDPERYREISGVDCKRLCYAADPSVFKYTGMRKNYTIGFSGALHQNKIYAEGAMQGIDVRRNIQEHLSVRSDVRCFLNGSDSVSPRIKNYEEYAKKIRESAMWFATPAAFGDITPRYFEVPMSGTLLLCSKVHDRYKDIFRDGENCIQFKEDGSDFIDKFEMCKNNPDLVKKISSDSAKEFSEKHTWDARAKEFIKEICTCL